MTSPFGTPPEQPDREADPEETQTPSGEVSGRPALTEDDLWAADQALPAAVESHTQEATSALSAGVTSANGGVDLAANQPALAADDAAADDPLPGLAAADGPFAGLADAEDVPGESGRRVRRVTWEILQTLVLAGLIFLLVRGVAQNFRVEGPSMEPGLHNGQYLLVNKAVYFKLDFKTLSKYVPFVSGGSDPSKYLFHSPKRGDVIVFRYPKDPSRDFIKRVIGVPGDTVLIDNGTVSVNGVALDENYVSSKTSCSVSCQVVVPPHSYFVLGDNRSNSSDSRSWGFVPEDNIIGKAMFSYWPLSQLGGVGNRSLNLGFVHLPLF